MRKHLASRLDALDPEKLNMATMVVDRLDTAFGAETITHWLAVESLAEKLTVQEMDRLMCLMLHKRELDSKIFGK